MIVKKNDIRISDIVLIQNAVPKGYTVRVVEGVKGGYAVRFRGTIVAVVEVSEAGDLDFGFLGNNPSLAFKKAMEETYVKREIVSV